MALVRKNILKAMKALYDASATLKAAVVLANTVAQQEQKPPFMVMRMTIDGKGPSFDEDERSGTVKFIIVAADADTACDIADLVDAVYDEKVPSITGVDADVILENVGESQDYDVDLRSCIYNITYRISFVVT